MQKQSMGLSTNVLVKAALLAAVSVVLTRFFSYMVPLGGLPALRVGFGSVPLIVSGIMLGPLVGGIVGVVSDVVGYMINPMGGAYFPGFTLTAALYGVISGILFKNFKIHQSKINYNYVNAIFMLVFAVSIFVLMLQTKVLENVNGKLTFNDTTAVPMLLLMVLVTVLFIVLPFVMGRWFKTADKGIAFDKIGFTVTLTYVINALFLNTLWLTMMLDKGFIVLLPGRIIASVITIPIYSWILFTMSKFIKMT